MLHSNIAHSIICTRLFRGKMHSDWFKGIEILQGRWQHGEKVQCCIAALHTQHNPQAGVPPLVCCILPGRTQNYLHKTFKIRDYFRNLILQHISNALWCEEGIQSVEKRFYKGLVWGQDSIKDAINVTTWRTTAFSRRSFSMNPLY